MRRVAIVEALRLHRRLVVQILVGAELAAGIVLASFSGFGLLQGFTIAAMAAWTPVSTGNLQVFTSSPVLWVGLVAAGYIARFIVMMYLRAFRADRPSLLDRREAGAGHGVADSLHGPQLVDDHPA